MGLSESTIKLILDPVNHFVSVCGHTQCESSCSDCFSFKITTNDTDSKYSRESHEKT